MAGPRSSDRVINDRALADGLAKLVVGRDEELGRDLQVVLGYYLEMAIPEYPDADSDLRRQARRLTEILQSLAREFGEEPPPDARFSYW